MDQVTVQCPFCDDMFLMTRPLFIGERGRTGCPSCRAKAVRNTQRGREELARARREVAEQAAADIAHAEIAS